MRHNWDSNQHSEQPEFEFGALNLARLRHFHILTSILQKTQLRPFAILGHDPAFAFWGHLKQHTMFVNFPRQKPTKRKTKLSKGKQKVTHKMKRLLTCKSHYNHSRNSGAQSYREILHYRLVIPNELTHLLLTVFLFFYCPPFSAINNLIETSLKSLAYWPELMLN